MFYLIVAPKKYVQCLTNYKPENPVPLCANFQMTFVNQDDTVRRITIGHLSYKMIHHTFLQVSNISSILKALFYLLKLRKYFLS